MYDECSRSLPSGRIRRPPGPRAGFRTGCRSSVRPHPSGASLPCRWYVSNLPAETTDVAASKMNGVPSAVGAAIAIGLDPSLGSAPPAGSTIGPVFVMLMPIMSCASACVEYTPAAPKCRLFATVTHPEPTARAFSMARFMARTPTLSPSPPSASIVAVEGDSARTIHSGRAFTNSFSSGVR